MWCSTRFEFRSFIYIDDVNIASTILQLILFADDFFSHKDAGCLVDILNTESNKLSIWLSANRFSLNIRKYKFMVFKPSQNPQVLKFSFNFSLSILLLLQLSLGLDL